MFEHETDTHSEGSVTFYVDNPPDNLPADGSAQYRITCSSEDPAEEALECDLGTEKYDDCTISGFSHNVYSCTAVVHHGPNRSKKSSAMSVRACHGKKVYCVYIGRHHTVGIGDIKFGNNYAHGSFKKVRKYIG